MARHFLTALLCGTAGLLPCLAFTSAPSGSGDIHAQITREALRGTVSDANIDFIVKSCDSQDATGGEGAGEARRHFKDATLSGALGYMDRERKKALNYAADADTDAESRAEALRHFGLMLHTAQDFYSHTNYLELQLENPASRQDPYNIELVEWSRVPDGYVGKASGDSLGSGKSQGEGKAAADFNKETAESAEGKKAIAGTTYFKLAKALAVRETQRQWNMFEALVRGRYMSKSPAIVTALRNASPAATVSDAAAKLDKQPIQTINAGDRGREDDKEED